MKAVMYGGGNIGRGFIGALLSSSGYDVTFIDVSEPVIENLCKKGEYPLRYVDTGAYEDITVKNVTAVNGNDTEKVSDAIAQCNIMATAVGAHVLKFIVPNIIAGLRKRWATGKDPLNIIICENLMDAHLILRDMLKAGLTPEEHEVFDKTVGLVEASIGRMVPVQTDEMKDGDPMRVCVEKYGFLPVDGAAFIGRIPDIKNMIPYAPFDFFIKRKLYVHNMGHAICAYLGDILGLEYIYQSIDVSEVRLLVHNAMLESAQGICKKYDESLESLQMHITDLLFRFTNAALRDMCMRVGADPARKLAPDDRLIGAALLASGQGITPAYIALGAAAGVYRYIKENGMEQIVSNAAEVLRTISKLPPDSGLASLVLEAYELIESGKSLKDLLAYCDRIKHDSMPDVV